MKGIREDEDADVSMDAFSIVAIDLIATKQYGHLENYLVLIERFLESKHHIVKSALLGSFIPAMFQFLKKCEWKQEVISLFPANLRQIYAEYVNHEATLVQNDLKEFIIHLN